MNSLFYHATVRRLITGIVALGIGWFSLAGMAQEAPIAASLRQALTAHGWQVKSLSDGSVILVPPGPTSGAAASTPAVAAEPGVPEELKQRLEAAGWGVERDATGSLILYPPGEISEPAAAKTSPHQEDQVVEMLRQRGWQAHRSADGSLILYPAGAQALVRPTPSAGIAVAPVTDGRISLPVDTWSEAHQIASAWLEQVALTGASIGKIRRILRVYLVSVVEARAPHRLQHQLAIRSEDGRVILLD